MPGFNVLSSAVDWLPWGAAAFGRAREEGKPILLSLAASWCGSCRRMDDTTYADPLVATAINRRFIPIRVDVDDRPDLSERYTLGGWPTTAFLTPAGEILGGGTFVAPERMRAVLDQVCEAYAASGEHRVADIAETQPSAPGPAAADAELHDLAFATFDRDHAGFGVEPKFPLVAPLRLALDLSTDAAPSYREMVEASLDAMGWGGLYDVVDGGFFRYAADRRWDEPHTEKLLETNAALLRLYLDAGAAYGLTRFTERAADVLRYIQTWLADPVDGGWAGSQCAADPYYAADAADRAALTPPAVRRVLYADGNAQMASAALHAAAVFGDDGLRDFALKSLERVLLACYKPGQGVAHAAGGGRVRGLFGDQAAMMAANLDAFETTSNVVYEMMAEELAHYAVRTMWDEAGGGFFDRASEPGEPDEHAGDVGLLRQRLKPFMQNCEMSHTLRRLAAASGDNEFTALADRTLAAMAPLAAAQGPLAAGYLLAVRAAELR